MADSHEEKIKKQISDENLVSNKIDDKELKRQELELEKEMEELDSSLKKMSLAAGLANSMEEPSENLSPLENNSYFY